MISHDLRRWEILAASEVRTVERLRSLPTSAPAIHSAPASVSAIRANCGVEFRAIRLRHLALRPSSDTRVVLQADYLSNRRVADFGIPAFKGRPAEGPAATYYGVANAAAEA